MLPLFWDIGLMGYPETQNKIDLCCLRKAFGIHLQRWAFRRTRDWAEWIWPYTNDPSTPPVSYEEGVFADFWVVAMNTDILLPSVLFCDMRVSFQSVNLTIIYLFYFRPYSLEIEWWKKRVILVCVHKLTLFSAGSLVPRICYVCVQLYIYKVWIYSNSNVTLNFAVLTWRLVYWSSRALLCVFL